ncbi:Mpp10 family of U3 processosome [Cryptosporidium sp. chipmunk genotype I]|uniref:Mpp10 family of U3 processosome n=1 Tax=Cryptosporidium sp. chipmunk genotype I TaxID=1280935 RepID=UPI00351A2BB0|nr:Mpp10 family of U3 processosome [Cryptosporidium sp. chipmunk genotype I]
MEEINVFFKFFESGLVNQQQIIHENYKMKKVIFSIFKLIIKDLDKRTLVDGLINKFEIDNSSLWNSFELILKPELKKLNLKIEDIAKKVDFELYNSNSIFDSNKNSNQVLLIRNKQREITNKNSKECSNRIKRSDQTLTNNKSLIQNNESVDFFDYDEMVKFIDEGVKNPNFNYSESDISDFSYTSEVDNASNLKYDDFFVDVKSNIESVFEKSPEDYETNVSLSESEITLSEHKPSENLINNIQSPSSKLVYVSKLNQHKNKMDIIIDELEENIIKEKEWYKLGETSITDREKNSLLDIHLEVPQFSSMSNLVNNIDGINNEIVSSDKFKLEEVSPYLESIVKQRIIDDLFDDIKPKIELLKTLDKETNNKDTDIQIEKSKLSLAEIYSKKYQEQIIGNINEEYFDEKKQLSGLFTEIMCKLDNLSNQYYVTNLPILRDTVLNENTPALKTEDSIPVIISDNARLAPQEIKSQGELLTRSEMTRPERKSDRNSIKRKIKKRKEADASSKNEHKKLKNKIKGKLVNKRRKLVSKPYEHESFNKRFKSHHFIS